MKIGIITWFTGPNYGTHLQAIALQEYLRKSGHKVQIVNYEPLLPQELKKPLWQVLTDWNILCKKLSRQPEKYAFKCAAHKYKDEIQRKDELLAQYLEQRGALTEKVESEEELIRVLNGFDLLVCGSDQIWNPQWYHPFYYADYDAVTTRRISYAPSLAVNVIEDEKVGKIQKSLSKFEAVSVREKKGAELLAPFIKQKIEVVIDPTMLLSAQDWKKLFPISDKHEAKKYVLCMFLTDNAVHWRTAKRFAKDKNLKLLVLPYEGISYFQRADIVAGAGLQEFLSLIHEAEYVLTDSYHVTIFSLLFHRQFYTFTRFKEDFYTSQNARLRNLLKIAKAENRLLPYKTEKIIERKSIDYNVVDKALKVEIANSKAFLTDAIGE